jgi:predicted chitinase/GNAT superfamily N-acetyltransferase
MRATEFINESVNPDCFNPAFNDTQIFDGLTYRAGMEAHLDKKYFVIKVFDDNFERVGLVKFKPYKNSNGEYWLESLITAIHPDYRGKGIARNAYAYARMLGNNIKPSNDQSDQGRAMWQSWKNSGDAEHLMREEIKLPDQNKAKAWIDKVYQQFPQTWQNNHVMPMGGEGENQQFAMFELVPSMSKKGAVEVKWFQAYPLRQGVGSRAMQELQRLAKEDGVGLTLFPWAHGQVSQPKLTKFYKSQGFKPAMKGSKSLSWDHELDEGWKDWVAGAAMGAAALSPQAIDAKPIQPTQKPAIVQPAQNASAGYNVLSNNSTNEITLQKAARVAGMKGAELAQFMAQMKHESWDFDRMKEKAQPGVKDYYAKRYDMKYSPKTAKILGNKHAGDGARYHGRGFVQLTGRDNYRMASDALGLDLLKNPDLASKPEVAAKIAVWYWNTRVKPNVRNFADTASVTKYINPAARGLENRDSNFKDYMRII